MNVSVIIPTYNRAYCLPRAFDSLLNQTHKPKQVIIVDDGSNDSTNTVIKSYKQIFQKRAIKFLYIQQINQGVSVARNVGIEQASEAWLAFLDSDDVWEPNKLQQQIAALKSEPQYKICHTNEKWIRKGVQVNPMKKHEKKGGWIYQNCLRLCAISPSSVLLHKDILNHIGVFDVELPACEDYDLWLRITAFYPVLYLEAPLVIKYGGHEDQLSRKHWGMDRFRIYALGKMLKSESLNEENRRATELNLKTKLCIFLKGAKKHNNYEYIKKYEHYLDFL